MDKAAGKEGVNAVYTWVYPGEKRKVEDAKGKGYGYWGDFLYRLEGRSLNLKEACFAGGKFVPAAGGCAVYYYLSDHLGSVRAVLDSSGNVLERSDYYPFGSRHLRPDYPLLAGNRFRYNGKEEQTTGGLGFLDYGARMYDSGLGRWTAGDPLSETYWGISPYAYCANNPLSFTDPTGMWIDDYFTYSGKYLGHDDASSDLVRLIFQEKWDENKFMNSEGEEMISHKVGYDLSKSPFETILTDEASLRIYDHYNMTGLSLIHEEHNKGLGGMAFHYTLKYGDPYLKIRLDANKKSGLSEHANEIINSFIHENQHYKEYQNLGKLHYNQLKTAIKEIHAINEQKLHESYNKTRPSFRAKINKYEEKYIWESIY